MRGGTQDASDRGAATMVVARSATGIGGVLDLTRSGRSCAVGRRDITAMPRDPKVSPTFVESEQGFHRLVLSSARKVARGGLNAEGGTVGGENANWVFE